MSEKLGRRGLFGALAGLCAAAVGVDASESLTDSVRRYLRNNKGARVYGIESRFAAHQAHVGDVVMHSNGAEIAVDKAGNIVMRNAKGDGIAVSGRDVYVFGNGRSADGITWTKVG